MKISKKWLGAWASLALLSTTVGGWVHADDDTPKKLSDIRCAERLDPQMVFNAFEEFKTAFSDPVLASELIKAATHRQWGVDDIRRAHEHFKLTYAPEIALMLTQNAALVDWNPMDIEQQYSLLLTKHSKANAAVLNRAGSYWDWGPEAINEAYDGFSVQYDSGIRARLAEPAIYLNWAPRDIDNNYVAFRNAGFNPEPSTKLAKVTSFVDWNPADVLGVYRETLAAVKDEAVAVELTSIAVLLEAKGRSEDVVGMYEFLDSKYPGQTQVALNLLKTITGVGILLD